MDDINRQDAIRVHDRSLAFLQRNNEASVKGGEVAIRTAMLINGGAAVAAASLRPRGHWRYPISPTTATRARSTRKFSLGSIRTSSMATAPAGGGYGPSHSTLAQSCGPRWRWSCSSLG
jgi:hypothetical protein